MRPLRREVVDSREWKRAEPIVKTIYNELRPLRGVRVIAWTTGLSEFDAFFSAIRPYPFDLTATQAHDAMVGLKRDNLFQFVPPEGETDGTITIPSVPPSVEAERARRAESREQERQARYASQRGKFGGLSDAERQDRRRKGLVAPRQPVVGDAPPARDVPSSAASDVTENVTAQGVSSAPDSETKIRDVSAPSTRAPAPTPAPPPPPLGGGGGRSGGGGEGQQPGAERRTTGDRRSAPSAPPNGPKTPRTPSDLARLTPLEVGTWASEILAPSMQVFTAGGVADRKCLGQLIVDMGLGEDDMRLLAEHWRRQPVPAIRVVQSVIGPLMTRLPAGNIDRKVLTATLAAARDWQRTTMPGPARAGAPPPGDKIAGTS